MNNLLLYHPPSHAPVPAATAHHPSFLQDLPSPNERGRVICRITELHDVDRLDRTNTTGRDGRGSIGQASLRSPPPVRNAAQSHNYNATAHLFSTVGEVVTLTNILITVADRFAWPWPGGVGSPLAFPGFNSLPANSPHSQPSFLFPSSPSSFFSSFPPSDPSNLLSTLEAHGRYLSGGSLCCGPSGLIRQDSGADC
ncbi:hypothetical protein SODALDRAFT_148621 [Sodiomyces alkalinus F11]|uniref:Uncharacterized protein n=1 Tax=Sodiomyces alkalinus (strain CBS 110278 / VKM F-3762 / F11) TaxID=1314773 RepID=A0A3N2PWM7_SODAK|nr:hypothetical protein SODALDRAFT_148621 [Sodiomyces alkalinus F11]ROT38921.1 hypothetical protein SODALDRAFT_148621 [Sodiomyces alkalinus F11]